MSKLEGSGEPGWAGESPGQASPKHGILKKKNKGGVPLEAGGGHSSIGFMLTPEQYERSEQPYRSKWPYCKMPRGKPRDYAAKHRLPEINESWYWAGPQPQHPYRGEVPVYRLPSSGAVNEVETHDTTTDDAIEDVGDAGAAAAVHEDDEVIYILTSPRLYEGMTEKLSFPKGFDPHNVEDLKKSFEPPKLVRPSAEATKYWMELYYNK